MSGLTSSVSSKAISLLVGFLFFVGLLLLPPPSGLGQEAWRVLAMAALMLSWWITEAVPIPVTAMLPIVLLPMLGVLPLREAAAPYADPVVFLFLGGFMLALSMERWNLHRRIALNIVLLTGTHANGVILGFMLATFALSMWISNTATAVMMLPIALSVIRLLTANADKNDQGVHRFALCMMLGIAYAANIGGTATLIGTPPNVVLAGFMRVNYNHEISFAAWMGMVLPFALTLLLLSYWFMVKVLYPNRLGHFAGAKKIIRQSLLELGPATVGERRTLLIFLLTASAWVFKTQLNQILPFQISDTEIALLAALALFIVPVSLKTHETLLTWEDTQRLPWGILLLFGGGLSLAGALKSTGVIDLIGAHFTDSTTTGFAVLLGLTAISLFLTEIMSNVALVTVMLPVVAGIATAMGIDPLIFCIPVTLAASCAFMLPMATPPNAIVFASQHLKVAEMVRAGFWLNLIAVLLISLLAYFVLI